MSFDMRPSLLADSRLNLIALTLIAGQLDFEEQMRRFEARAQATGLISHDDFERNLRSLAPKVGGFISIVAALAVGIFFKNVTAAMVAAIMAFFVSFWIYREMMRAEYRARLAQQPQQK